jgi:hypothetical protein
MMMMMMMMIFEKYSNIKFRENPSMRTNGRMVQTEMVKLEAGFHIFAKEP